MRDYSSTLRPARRELLKEESGQDLVEYSLLMVVIALGASAAMTSVSMAISRVFLTLSALFPH